MSWNPPKEEFGPQQAMERVASMGLVDELRRLLEQGGADPKASAHYGVTALIQAANRGHDACVELLIPVSDVRAGDLGGATALSMAAIGGHVRCVELLLAATPPATEDALDGRPLSAAARGGSRACVEMLLGRYGADARCPQGMTPLMHAIQAGREECVAALLPHSDLDAKQSEPESRGTAEDFAKRDSRWEFVRMIGAERARRERAEISAGVAPGGARSPTPRV